MPREREVVKVSGESKSALGKPELAAMALRESYNTGQRVRTSLFDKVNFPHWPRWPRPHTHARSGIGACTNSPLFRGTPLHEATSPFPISTFFLPSPTRWVRGIDRVTETDQASLRDLWMHHLTIMSLMTNPSHFTHVPFQPLYRVQ